MPGLDLFLYFLFRAIKSATPKVIFLSLKTAARLSLIKAIVLL
jgi:hypothetical protein